MSRRLSLYASLIGLLLVALGLLSVGCSPESPQSTFDAAGEVSRKQLNLFYIIFWAAVFVFISVEGLLIYAVFRYRKKPGQGTPSQVHGNPKLEIAWTVAPAIVLIVIAVPTVITLMNLSTTPSNEDQVKVEVVGHQWWWEFRYPDLDIVTANELHIPAGKVINLRLESSDVIHSFWVPKLAGKKDVLPSQVNTLWVRADKPGVYFGQCAEFCGLAHAQMRFRVIAQSEEEFARWAEDFRRPEIAPAGLAADGAKLFNEKGCIACHTIQDNPIARGTRGPSLTHFGARTTLAAGLLENDQFGENLTRWLKDPESVKPGNIMGREAAIYPTSKNYNPELAWKDNLEIAAIVEYLKGLKPDLTKPPVPIAAPGATPTPPTGATPTPPLPTGNPEAGKRLFASQGCSACHSLGTDTLVGPGLSGMATRAASREPGLGAEQYIYKSIVDPGSFVVPPFPNAMPSVFRQLLSDRDLSDLIAYLMTLK